MREHLLKKILDLLAKKGTNTDLSQNDILDGMLKDEGISPYKIISKKDLDISSNTYTRLLSACVDMDIVRKAGENKAARYTIGHLGYICLWAMKYPKTELPPKTALEIELSIGELVVRSTLKFYASMYVLPIWEGNDTLLREYIEPSAQEEMFSEHTILLRDAGLIQPEDQTKTSGTKYKVSKTGQAVLEVLNQILFSKNPPVNQK